MESTNNTHVEARSSKWIFCDVKKQINTNFFIDYPKTLVKIYRYKKNSHNDGKFYLYI